MNKIPPDSPLLMPAGELKRRWARWNRRYRTVADWIAAHPGEAAGGLVGVAPPVTYYKVQSKVGSDWIFYGGFGRHAASRPHIVSEAEFRASAGLPPREPIPAEDLPKWPATPEKWAKGRTQPPTKAVAIKRIRAQMVKLGVSLTDLVPELAAPKANGNGHAKLPKPKPRKQLTPADAGWK